MDHNLTLWKWIWQPYIWLCDMQYREVIRTHIFRATMQRFTSLALKTWSWYTSSCSPTMSWPKCIFSHRKVHVLVRLHMQNTPFMTYLDWNSHKICKTRPANCCYKSFQLVKTKEIKRLSVINRLLKFNRDSKLTLFFLN